MDNKEYDKIDAIRRSDLAEYKKSPAHYQYAISNETESTPALVFGSAVHKYILEADDFFNEYAVSPRVDRRTKEGKEIYAEFVASAKEKTIVSTDDFEKMMEMRDALMKNDEAWKLLQGEHEVPMIWEDDLTGEKCKVKPDTIHLTEGGKYVIVDYKTTDSCQDGHFERSMRKYNYYLQAGMYLEGFLQYSLEDATFAFVAQEKKAPYASRVYYMSKEAVLKGYDEFRELIGLHHQCKENDKWPGYEAVTIVEEES